MCDCLNRVNAAMSRQGFNGAIETNLLANPPRALIRLFKPRRQGLKPPVLEASYCPFCGKKYRKGKELAAQKQSA